MDGIIAEGVVIFMICTISPKYNKCIKTFVSKYEEMKNKYKLVVDFLKASDCRIIRETKNHLEMSTKSSLWTLDYVGLSLKVHVKIFVPLLGSISKKWIFPEGYSQEEMIKEFNDYANRLVKQIKEVLGNNLC